MTIFKFILCLVVFYLILSLLLIIIDILRGRFVLNILNSDGSNVTGIKYIKALIIGFIFIWFSYLYIKLFVNSGEE